MPKRHKPKPSTKPKRRRPATISAAATQAAGPLILEAELTPDDWEHLEAAADESTGQPRIPTFRMVAYRGGVMRPRLSSEMYGDGVVVDLATARVVAGQLPVHYVHDTRDPVGHADTFENDGRQINITGRLSVPGPSTDRIAGGARNGFRWRPSISARGFTLERLLPGQTATVNGRPVRGPAMIARRAEIYEVSFLSVAGDPTATANVSASANPETVPDSPESAPMNFDQFLADCGVNAATLTAEQRANLEAAYQAQYGDDNDEPNPGPGTGNPGLTADEIAEQNRRAAANRARIARIETLCATAGSPTLEVNGAEVDLAAHAIESGMDPRDVELHILRTNRPRGPAVHSRSSDETHNVQAMTAAVLLAGGIPLDHAAFTTQHALFAGVPEFLRRGINDDRRQQIMEAGHRYGAVNMMDLAGDAIELETGNRVRNREDRIRAAASSGSLSTIYSHSVGAALLVGFAEAAGTVGAWTSQEFLPDFKQVERFTEDGEDSLELIEPNGEAAHATSGVSFEYLKVDMYGRQFVIDRYAYVNNNLGLIARKPRMMGQTARRLEEDFAYGVLLSNPTMLSTGRALFNTTDGTLHASHPLSIANGRKAVAYMKKRTDGDKSLDLVPGFALVPAELHDLSVDVFTSATKDSADGNNNALRDHNIRTISTGRLSNGVTHPKTKQFAAGSATAWFTVARDVEVAVRVYLQETGGVPQTRVTPLTQGRWGQHIDISFDFGFGFVTTKGADKFTA